MGWTNYIIIQKLKLIVEISRNINEISDYQKKALDYLISEDRYEEDDDIGNKNVKNISVKDLTLLFSIYEQVNNIVGMESDKLFLYWLESKGFKYEIISEFEIMKNNQLETYKNEGYTILRIFGDDNL